ncbi:MAG: hypothetical protein K6T29_03720 [Peptococcaceae bacterium]|nr:hypothetical protein [Peptococcaceae bacterium]
MNTAARSTLAGAPGPLQKKAFVLSAVKILTAVFFLFCGFLWKNQAWVRFYGYGAIRELVKAHTLLGTWRMSTLKSDHFYVKFRPEDRPQALLVLETAEHFYGRVTGDFGFAPRARIPIILYSTREELNASFGWEARESAIGVYWAGVIRVLAPAAWVFETEPARVKETFISAGPLAHELTHLMVDYLTGGNYPRWFTEGVAQYEEYKLTGFEFGGADGPLQAPLYSMQELGENFDGLPNQTLAYRESLLAVRYIVQQCGEEALHDLIKELGRGRHFNQALQTVTQLDEAAFEAKWREWALNNFQW